MAAGKAQFVQLEQRQISLFAHRQFAEISASQQLRRALGGPAQHQMRGDFFGAVAQALQVKRLAGFEDHVRCVVGRRAIDPKPHRRASSEQIQGWADAGGQAHVRARAVADTGTCCAKTGDFVGVEVDAMGQPGTRTQPADAVQIIHGTQAEALQAEVFFVEGFSQVGVQAHVEFFGHGRALGHDLRRDRKR